MINIAVKDGLRVLGAQLQKILYIVKGIKRSPYLKGQFEEITSDNEPGTELVNDVATRWNATYLMLKRAPELKAALTQFASRHCHKFVLSDEEWAALEEICEYLAEFDKSSVFLSAVSYPTLSCIYPIWRKLLRHTEGQRGILERIASLMNATLRKYWTLNDPDVLVAHVLDTRFKCAFVPL